MALTHEERMVLALELNKALAATKKAATITTQDMIRSDTLTPEEIEQLVAIFPIWQPGVAYEIDDLCGYDGVLYQVLQPHIAQADWLPPLVPALYKSKALEAVIPLWKQPTGAHDTYNTGDRVLYDNKVYESLIDNNAWSPIAYPAGWQQIEL